jgi:hypothetical protein
MVHARENLINRQLPLGMARVVYLVTQQAAVYFGESIASLLGGGHEKLEKRPLQ